MLVEHLLGLALHRDPSFSLSTARSQRIAPSGFYTVIGDQKELEKLDDAHACGVEDGWAEDVPVVLFCLLRGEEGHLTKRKDEPDVDQT